ncbi:MAG: ATPase [Rhodospirillaceae bacterium]|nr:ATPase [Rhodospirillaceae bacterium]
MKRFWREVAIAAGDSGFAVTLDGKPVRTGRGEPLVVAHAALAQDIAAEWRGQGEKLDPATMPLTRIAGAAIDRDAADRAAVIDRVAAFAGTDLICYRANSPSALAQRQATQWQPLIDWAAGQFGARLHVVDAIAPCPQPPAALATLREAVNVFDDLRLAALEAAVMAAGSLIIGLALAEGRLDADEAAAMSQLDELFQAERWGDDPDAVRSREERRQTLAAAAAVFAAAGT